MKRMPLLLLLIFYCVSLAPAQIFTYKRQNKWQARFTPSVGLLLNHTGIDQTEKRSVTDLIKWGLGSTIEIGVSTTRFSFGNELRLEYQQTHRNDQLPIKGPSIFKFTTQPQFKLTPGSPADLNLTLQVGVLTSLLPVKGSDGVTTREFFDPAAISEGLYLRREEAFGEAQQLRIAYEIGYAFQQLVYRTEGRQVGAQFIKFPNIVDNGVASGISLVFSPPSTKDRNDRDVVSFNAILDVRFQKRKGISGGLSQSRVDGEFRTSLIIFGLLEFRNSIVLEYDSALSKRRYLTTSVSMSLKYNIDLAGD